MSVCYKEVYQIMTVYIDDAWGLVSATYLQCNYGRVYVVIPTTSITIMGLKRLSQPRPPLIVRLWAFKAHNPPSTLKIPGTFRNK